VIDIETLFCLEEIRVDVLKINMMSWHL